MDCSAGPRRMKRNLVLSDTSVKSPRSTAFFNRTNAHNASSRNSTSPTRMFAASASLSELISGRMHDPWYPNDFMYISKNRYSIISFWENYVKNNQIKQINMVI